MPNLNKVMLMGNLTRDPEMRYAQSGNAIASLGLAINRKWRNQQGEQQEETTFIDCDAFGRTAETINQYLRKGNPIFIEGRLKLDQWQDQQGQNRSKLKVIVESFQFISTQGSGASGGGGYSGGQGHGGQYHQPRSAGYGQQQYQGNENGGPPVEDDDIPF